MRDLLRLSGNEDEDEMVDDVALRVVLEEVTLRVATVTVSEESRKGGCHLSTNCRKYKKRCLFEHRDLFCGRFCCLSNINSRCSSSEEVQKLNEKTEEDRLEVSAGDGVGKASIRASSLLC